MNEVLSAVWRALERRLRGPRASSLLQRLGIDPIYVTNATTTPVVTPAGTCPAGVACIFWQDSNGITNGEVDISTSGLPNGNIPANIGGNDAATISTLMNPTEPVDMGGFPPALFMTFLNGGITTTLSIDNIAPGIFSSAACDAPAPVSSARRPDLSSTL
jgi:hypothetical protein